MPSKPKNIFIDGPVAAEKIASVIAAHSEKTYVGAHSIFLGQVRADAHAEGVVREIEYSAYVDMALERAAVIRESLFERYPISCLHVLHSLGTVRAGEVCLFVMVSSPHRQAAGDACAELVERIKGELPVWGKELLESGDAVWKKNT